MAAEYLVVRYYKRDIIHRIGEADMSLSPSLLPAKRIYTISSRKSRCQVLKNYEYLEGYLMGHKDL